MIEIVFISAALLLLISVRVSKISDRFGVPALLLGMLVLADPKIFSEVQARFEAPAAEEEESAGKTTEYDI